MVPHQQDVFQATFLLEQGRACAWLELHADDLHLVEILDAACEEQVKGPSTSHLFSSSITSIRFHSLMVSPPA